MNYILKLILENMSVSLGYIILFFIGAPANLLVIYKLLHGKCYKRSRYHFLLLNLSIADSMVVFIMIPVEIGWLYTNAWLAGNVACKVIKFFCAFGPYSSSLLLICLSVDRYYAVARPFSYAFLDRQINILLVIIWSLSFIISLPQLIIFSVKTHPERPDFTQCVDFDFFPEKWQEQTYTISSLIFLYFLPLVFIIFCYSAISCIIIKRSRIEDEKSIACKENETAHAIRGSVTNVIEMEDLVIGNGSKQGQSSSLTHDLAMTNGVTHFNGTSNTFNQGQPCSPSHNLSDNLDNLTNQSTNGNTGHHPHPHFHSESNIIGLLSSSSPPTESPVPPSIAQITINPLESEISDATMATINSTTLMTTVGGEGGGGCCLNEKLSIENDESASTTASTGQVVNCVHQSPTKGSLIRSLSSSSSPSVDSSIKGPSPKSFNGQVCEVSLNGQGPSYLLDTSSVNSKVKFNTNVDSIISSSDRHVLAPPTTSSPDSCVAFINGDNCQVQINNNSSQPESPSRELILKNGKLTSSELKVQLLVQISSKINLTESTNSQGKGNRHGFGVKSKATSANCIQVVSGGNCGTNEKRSSSRQLCQDRVMIRKNSIKRRILNQTLVIIVTFIICWTPYVFIAMWYQIDPDSTARMGGLSTDYLFMFAVSNSVVNPYIYGKFLFK